MASIDMGKVISKIISKVRKEGEKPVENAPVEGPAASQAGATPGFPIGQRQVYLKASAMNSLNELSGVKDEVRAGNILIIRVSPLAEKDLDDVKRAVSELSEFAQQIGGDIARLGEDRVVITPSFVKIWREKTEEAEGLALTGASLSQGHQAPSR